MHYRGHDSGNAVVMRQVTLKYVEALIRCSDTVIAETLPRSRHCYDSVTAAGKSGSKTPAAVTAAMNPRINMLILGNIATVTFLDREQKRRL